MWVLLLQKIHVAKSASKCSCWLWSRRAPFCRFQSAYLTTITALVHIWWCLNGCHAAGNKTDRQKACLVALLLNQSHQGPRSAEVISFRHSMILLFLRPSRTLSPRTSLMMEGRVFEKSSPGRSLLVELLFTGKRLWWPCRRSMYSSENSELLPVRTLLAGSSQGKHKDASSVPYSTQLRKEHYFPNLFFITALLRFPKFETSGLLWHTLSLTDFQSR